MSIIFVASITSAPVGAYSRHPAHGVAIASTLDAAAESPPGSLPQPGRPRGPEAPPSGSILVTGYTSSNLMGNPQRSTEVRVSGLRAEPIRRAFDRLPRSSPPDCMENASQFALTFIPAGSKTPVLRVVQWSCPSPGVVSAGRPGQRLAATLASSCALTQAVVSVLPAGKAPVTRQAADHCRLP